MAIMKDNFKNAYVHQHLLDHLSQYIKPGKVLILEGPRRVGKTTLITKYLENCTNYQLVAGEDIHVQHYLSSQSIETLKSFVGNTDLLVIDEAQNIPNIGLNLKLLVDHCPQLKIVATGSSAFDLAKQTGEPLTGRKTTLQMFPLAQLELNAIETPAQRQAHLEQRLIYGSYPEVVLLNGIKEKQRYLQDLVSSYLYKDILQLDGIKKPDKLIRLLQLLAFQVGKEVSLTEIGQQLGFNKSTVERYIDLLEKCFVLINISAFSRNLRKEISKQHRYYFYDTGVRNALIQQFNPLELRTDIGSLWENYLIIERIKKQHYHEIFSNNYFWRTYDKQEIDWIEMHEGKLLGYEFKWQPQHIKSPKDWLTTYPEAEFTVIHRDNYLDFIT